MSDWGEACRSNPRHHLVPSFLPQVFFHRKAQLLAVQLHLRFRGVDPRFQFADMDALTVDSGGLPLAWGEGWCVGMGGRDGGRRVLVTAEGREWQSR